MSDVERGRLGRTIQVGRLRSALHKDRDAASNRLLLVRPYRCGFGVLKLALFRREVRQSTPQSHT
jgi:hypothetical protein